jgi:hypothetical protein
MSKVPLFGLLGLTMATSVVSSGKESSVRSKSKSSAARSCVSL